MEQPQTNHDEKRGQATLDPLDGIRACLECARQCQEARAQVKTKAGRAALPDLLEALLDCAESCELTAKWLQRGSPFAADQAVLCSAVCKACEEACAAAGQQELLAACAAACRRCTDLSLRLGRAGSALVQ